VTRPIEELQKSIEEYYAQLGIKEYNFISIARQGMRLAIDVLAGTLSKQGKNVAVNTNLGRRSNSPNVVSLRYGDSPHLSLGVWSIHPTGLMVLHECLFETVELTPGREPGIFAQPVVAQRSGLLMLCTNRNPEEVSLPVNFEGTVATADAEAIYLDMVGRRPPPYGIASLGLFARAVPEVDFGLLKEKAAEHTLHFGAKVSEANVRAMEKVYEETKIKENLKIAGKQSREEYWARAQRTVSSLGEVLKAEEMVGYAWRTQLPVCNQKKCTCIECLAAYYCPEGAISWKDEVYTVDYEYCKGCGTCARECTEDAVSMKPAQEVLAKLAAGGSR